MITLIRFLLLVSLAAPTAKGQDPISEPAPAPTTLAAELPVAPASPPPVDPLASEPSVFDDLNLKPVDELQPARIVMEIPEPEITAEEVQKLLVSVYGEKDVADRVKVIKENNPLILELYSPMDQTVRGLIEVRRMDSPEQKKASRSSSETTDVREVKIVYLKNAAAHAVQSIVFDIFGADVKPGVDSRTNALILSGPAAKLNEALALVDTLDTAEPAPAAIQEVRKQALSYRGPREQKMGPAERRVGELLEERRLSLSRGTGKTTIDEEQKISLREAIAAAFDERQAQQLAEIEELSMRLQGLSKTVRGRQAKRQQMIERQLSDLLNPERHETTDEDRMLSDDKRLPAAAESLRSRKTDMSVYAYGPNYSGVLYFRADWSAPCKEFDTTVSRLKGDGAFIETIEVDKHPKVAKQFNVDVVPSLVLIRHGKVHSVIKGLTSYEEIRTQFDPKSQEFRPQGSIGHADLQSASGPDITLNTPPVKLSTLKFIVVNKGASLTLEADARIKSVSGFDTRVATVQAVEGNPRQLTIQGISENATTIIIQQEDQEPQSYDVRVKHDTRDIEMVLKQTFPGEAITVDAITETTVLLKGSVSTEVVRERAVSLAEQFYPSVLDHLEVRSATYESGSRTMSSLKEQDPSTESLFQSVMQLSSRAAAIKADLNGETGELRNRPKDDPRAIEVREQLNVGLAQIRAQAAQYQKFVTGASDLRKSRLENAKSELDRHRQLSEKGAVPISEVRKSEAALVEAEAAVNQLTQIQEVLSSIAAPTEEAKVEIIEN